MRKRANQNDAADWQCEIGEEIAEGIANLPEEPPLHPNDGRTQAVDRGQDGRHGLVGQDNQGPPPPPLRDVPFFWEKNVVCRA